jgi:upstream activation factor subunit UAF30
MAGTGILGDAQGNTSIAPSHQGRSLEANAGPYTHHKEENGMAKARGGLAQKVQPDAQLARVVGSQPMTRSEITKKVWDYVKKNGLQDKQNRRMINADDAMRPIFNGQNQVSMFEMTKLVNQHVSKT